MRLQPDPVNDNDEARAVWSVFRDDLWRENLFTIWEAISTGRTAMRALELQKLTYRDMVDK
jgi:hypothetical protein